MKELTIEQKAKAYDEALKKMKSWVKGEHPECFTEAQKAAEFIFPELKESEDERIRKDIIQVLKGEISFVSEKENEKYIAWLEKQGEKDKLIKELTEYKVKYIQETLEKYVNSMSNKDDERIRKAIYNALKYLEWELSWDFLDNVDILDAYKWLEKQGTSNPKSALEAWEAMRFEVYQQASGNRHGPNCSDDTTKMFSINDIDEIFEEICEQNPTDKVEPKFCKGAWLIENHPNNYARFIEILEIVNVQGKNKYRISRDLHNNEDVAECLFIEDNWHPFNIQDAKDGDVLASKDGVNIVIFRNLDSSTSFSSYYNIKRRGERGWSNDSFIPATKEQRDLLFKKMCKEGYEWDADKKELKKIEQKPTWSEEDAKKLSDILAILRGGENCYYNSHILVDWLKSLKERIGG